MKDLEKSNVGNNNDNDSEMEKKWDSIKEDYISKYSELRKEDLSYEKGGISGMFERIGRKRGRTLLQIQHEVSSWR
jgi:hypothetical protein